MRSSKKETNKSAAENKLASRVRSRVADAVGDRVGNAVGNRIGNAVGDRVGNAVGDRVGNAVGDRIGNAVGNRIGNAVGDRVGNAVGNRVGNAVGNRIGNAVGNRIGNAVGDRVGDAVGDRVGDAVGSRRIDALLNQTKYQGITRLIDHIKEKRPTVNVYDLILNKKLDDFLDEFAHHVGVAFVTRIRNVLNDFYLDCNPSVAGKLDKKPPKQYREAIVSITSSPLSSTWLLTLESLITAETAEKKLGVLNSLYNGTLSGWAMGNEFVRLQNWAAVNAYITNLKELETSLVRMKLKERRGSEPSFFQCITKSNVPPVVIFNLLNSDILPPEVIKTLAKKSDLKERIKAHIERLIPEADEKIMNVWDKCVSKDTSLGKFFRTPRGLLGLLTSESDNTTNLKAIKSLSLKISSDVKSPEYSELLTMLTEPVQSESPRPVSLTEITEIDDNLIAEQMPENKPFELSPFVLKCTFASLLIMVIFYASSKAINKHALGGDTQHVPSSRWF